MNRQDAAGAVNGTLRTLDIIYGEAVAHSAQVLVAGQTVMVQQAASSDASPDGTLNAAVEYYHLAERSDDMAV